MEDVPGILKEREGDNLGVMVKIENVVILKERDGDNLGVMVKIENVVILKERDGDNLQMVIFQELQKWRMSGMSLMKSSPFFYRW